MLKRLVAIAVIVLAFAVPVKADGGVVYLPIIKREGPPTTSRLSTGQVVVERGSLVVVKNVITTRQCFEWVGRWYWSQAVKIVGAYYEHGLWPPTTFRYDAPLDWTSSSVGMRQASFVPGDADEGVISELVLIPQAPGTVSVSHRLLIRGVARFAYRPLYVMNCVCDYDGDGERKLKDMVEVQDAVGCQQGDSCYSVWYDMDGDGRITINDVYISLRYWNVPCPEW